MMLLVERDMTPAIRHACRLPRRGGGSPAHVHDFDLRREQDAAMASRRSIAPDGTTVSLLSRRRLVPWLARMPTFVARANPRLSRWQMTWTPGLRAAASALPSLEPLSTTMISQERACTEAWSDPRHRSRSARALKETMMIETSGNEGSPDGLSRSHDETR